MLERNPGDPRLWTVRGVAQARQRQESESLASFRKALELSPNYLPALQGAAQIAYSRHDPGAPDWLRRIIAQDPANSTAHAMLGALAAESHDCRTAVSEFAQAASAIRGNAPALLQLGRCYVSLKNPEAARAAFQDAIKLAPSEEQNYVDLGILDIEQKQPQSAVEAVNEGLRLLPNSARLYAIRGAAHTWLNDPERAAQDFDKAEALEPEQLYGSVGLSMLLRQGEHLPEAIAILRNKIAEHPKDATLTFLLADTLIRAGIEPGQPSFDEAVHLLEQSIALNPQFRKARVSLGKLYLQASRTEEAARQFREAVRLDPKDRSALTQLALLLRRTGKVREADATVAELKKLMAEDTGH